MDLRVSGEQDIQRHITEDQIKAVLESVKNSCFEGISFEQIVCLVKSFERILRQISCDPNNSCLFAQIFKNYGFSGIASNIEMSFFSNSQRSYIVGCLYGLFPEDYGIGPKVFGVLFPETLVRITMSLKGIDYNTALNFLKPIIS